MSNTSGSNEGVDSGNLKEVSPPDPIPNPDSPHFREDFTMGAFEEAPSSLFKTVSEPLPWRSRFNPCGCCVCLGCSLRRNCFVGWFIAFIIIFCAEDRGPSSYYVNVADVVLSGLLIGVSVTAGFSIILGVITRSKLICIAHTLMDLFISGTLVAFMIVFFMEPIIDVYKILLVLAVIAVYLYFASCSYGLYLQIEKGWDFRDQRSAGRVGCH